LIVVAIFDQAEVKKDSFIKKVGLIQNRNLNLLKLLLIEYHDMAKMAKALFIFFSFLFHLIK